MTACSLGLLVKTENTDRIDRSPTLILRSFPMKYTLTTPQGVVNTFYIEAVAKLFQLINGGVITEVEDSVSVE